MIQMARAEESAVELVSYGVRRCCLQTNAITNVSTRYLTSTSPVIPFQVFNAKKKIKKKRYMNSGTVSF